MVSHFQLHSTLHSGGTIHMQKMKVKNNVTKKHKKKKAASFKVTFA